MCPGCDELPRSFPADADKFMYLNKKKKKHKSEKDLVFVWFVFFPPLQKDCNPEATCIKFNINLRSGDKVGPRCIWKRCQKLWQSTAGRFFLGVSGVVKG